VNPGNSATFVVPPQLTLTRRPPVPTKQSGAIRKMARNGFDIGPTVPRRTHRGYLPFLLHGTMVRKIKEGFVWIKSGGSVTLDVLTPQRISTEQLAHDLSADCTDPSH
jgi:hypothetical protein